MHRHNYRGRKLGRDTAQRKALLRNLSVSLIEHGTIETTLPKAKELLPFMEKTITKAKQDNLHARRQVISRLNDIIATEILFENIVPKLKRDSGHLRIEKTGTRRGDNAQLARVSFVDDLSEKKAAKKPAKKEEPKKEADK